MTRLALSIKQPWAALLVAGRKTVEVRRWATNYRGPLLIHASARADERPGVGDLVPRELADLAAHRGGILGEAVLTGCAVYSDAALFQADQARHLNDASWFEPPGLFGFEFGDARAVPFQPCPGWVRLFRVGEDTPPPAPPPAPPPVARDGPGLLVSVRAVEEVDAALAGGATLLDVKEPRRGALGRPDADLVARVVARAGGRVPVSVAGGEYLDAFGDACGGADASFARGCQYVKWGPSGVAGVEALRRSHAAAVALVARDAPGCQVVLVAYADWRAAGSPPPEEVAGLACRARHGVLLIDTFVKPAPGAAGPTLLDALPPPRLDLLTRLCRSSGVRIALAGSVGRAEIERLRGVSPDWFAVRGAACAGGRGGVVQAGLVRELSALARGAGAGSEVQPGTARRGQRPGRRA